MKIEISFKNDVADKVKLTVEADSEDIAKAAKGSFESMFDDVEVEQDGKNITITMDIKTFLVDLGGASESDFKNNKDTLTKKNLTEVLEGMGAEIE